MTIEYVICDACWQLGDLCADHSPEDRVDVAENSIRIDRLLDALEAWKVGLVRERDAYRAQAVAFTEALVELGHVDIVDRVLAETAS